MWRFLNSIGRVFKNHVHSPRPSAGLYVEEEQEALELNEKIVCPFTGRRRRSLDSDEHQGCSAKVLSSLFAIKRSNNQSSNNEATCTIKQSLDFKTGQENENKNKWSCHHDFWRMFLGSHRMLEAISWGSAVLLGSDVEKRRYKSRLLLRVLFTTPGSGTTIRTIKSDVGKGAVLQPKETSPASIKDATGATQDVAVNKLEAETLDSALEEFQSMCTEYTAKTESLLGIEAADHGDFNTAVKHLQSSCALGNTSACFNLGLCYETGSGVLQDLNKAKHYYRLAAIEGHSMALYNLGLMCMDCRNYNLEEKLAGSSCDCGCSKVEGLGFLEKAAKLGLAEAQIYLGLHHIEESHDVAKAVLYFKAAAEQNIVDAQYFLAICCEQGLGVEINECRAAQLYSLAANAGHEMAMYNLAVFNEHGLGGLPQDMPAAIELYKKSADLGCEQAVQRLEDMKTSQIEDEDRKMKVQAFQQLYLQHHKDEETLSSHHHITSRSPSASSPNLTEFADKDIPFFFGDHTIHITRGKDYTIPVNPVDNDRLSLKTRRRDFSLSSDGRSDDDDCSTSPQSEEYGMNESFESFTYDYFPSLKGLHKSHSHPNFSMVACSI